MTESWLGGAVAEGRLAELRVRIASGRARGWPAPALASLHQGGETPYRFYLRRQAKAAEGLGIALRAIPIEPAAGTAALAATLRSLSAERSVHGVIVEHPLPPPVDFGVALSALDPAKDIDGVGFESLGRLVTGAPLHVPAVAAAALRLARAHGARFAGRTVAVLGRSPTVGLPLALLLLARGEGGDASLLVGHSRTAELGAFLRPAEYIFSCVGRPGLLTRENVPRGARIIDVGVSSVEDPARPGGVRPVGDADAQGLEGWAKAITPVPGGVGPVTVAELMANVVAAWERQCAAGGP
jgi:methylenetetrahydrofolate dehydrogenase (NADP+)/methenyltetrahydrofolate cyclohydrolase